MLRSIIHFVLIFYERKLGRMKAKVRLWIILKLLRWFNRVLYTQYCILNVEICSVLFRIHLVTLVCTRSFTFKEFLLQ